MKLVLQIALGVFLGTLASQFTMDGWRSHQEKQYEKFLKVRR